MSNGYQLKNSGSAIKSMVRPIQTEEPSRLSYIKSDSRMSSIAEVSEKSDKKKIEESFKESYIPDDNKGQQAKPKDCLCIILRVPKQKGFGTEKIYSMNIHKSRVVEDLTKKLETWLSQDFGISKFSLLYKAALVDPKKTLAEADIT